FRYLLDQSDPFGPGGAVTRYCTVFGSSNENLESQSVHDNIPRYLYYRTVPYRYTSSGHLATAKVARKPANLFISTISSSQFILYIYDSSLNLLLMISYPLLTTVQGQIFLSNTCFIPKIETTQQTIPKITHLKTL